MVGDVMDINYDVITFISKPLFQNTFILRRPGIFISKPLFENTFILRRLGVAIFADIIKIVFMLIKEILEDSK